MVIVDLSLLQITKLITAYICQMTAIVCSSPTMTRDIYTHKEHYLLDGQPRATGQSLSGCQVRNISVPELAFVC